MTPTTPQPRSRATTPERKPASFNALFRTTLLPELVHFERLRRIRLPVHIAVGAIFVIVIVLEPLFWQVLFLLGALLLGFEGMSYRRGKQRGSFSRKVVAPLVRFAAPELKSLPAFYVGQGDYLDSKLFSVGFSRYEGRDYFSGSRPGYDLAFSWIRSSYTDANEKRMARTVFMGWYFVVTYHRHFRGVTVVQPDRAEATLGWMGRSLQEWIAPEGLELVLLEDAAFEQAFKVLTSDQLDARYVLSPKVMEMTTRLNRRVGGGMAFSFVRNGLYVAVPSRVEYFSGSPIKSFTDPAFCRQLFHAVTGVVNLADHFARNHRIWLDSP